MLSATAAGRQDKNPVSRKRRAQEVRPTRHGNKCVPSEMRTQGRTRELDEPVDLRVFCKQKVLE